MLLLSGIREAGQALFFSWQITLILLLGLYNRN
jgi:hypothetical protein